jgi:hypothetical protein
MQTQTTTKMPTAPKPHSLIASDRVEGTAVRRSDGKKIGDIQRLMIDKLSGKVAYAVLHFGGFLGIGDKHLPVPWQLMRYNPSLEAYEINLSDDELAKAPSYDAKSEFDWGDRDREIVIHDYYKTMPYWGAF